MSNSISSFSSLGPGIGYTLSLILFIGDQIRGKRASHDFIKEIETDRTIRDYLEWLRKQDHKKLVQRINENEEDLLRELGGLDAALRDLSTQLLHELREMHAEVFGRLRDLNARFALPVLSSIPLQKRPLTTVPLLSREKEMEWLQESASDVIISGQPGVGKTYLVYHFAKQCSARFLLSDNPDIAVSAVINGSSPVLIVDDAATKMDLIFRLIHARNEHGLPFRLVAICWPFELDDMQEAMGIPRTSILELSLLTRSVIAELILSIIKDAGYEAPNAIIGEIVDQAVGRPGLAVELTKACLQEDIKAVMRGETLARRMGQSFKSIVGDKAAQIMAAFAVGGKAGMEADVVSKVLDIPVFELHEALKDMAPGGVLQLLSKTRLKAIPKAMRRAILKEIFFKPGDVCLSTSVYETLLSSAPERDEAVYTLLDSVHVDADVDLNWLRKLVDESRAPKVWNAYAYLGERQCQYVMEKRPDMVSDITDAALHYLPREIIPQMLDAAVDDTRRLKAHSETPLRKLAAWVTHAGTETPSAVDRRRDLFYAIKNWLNAGGDRTTAFRAVKTCFTLAYEVWEDDPGDSSKITMLSGLLSLDAVKQTATLWPEFVEIAKNYGIPDWSMVTSIVDDWLHPCNHFGHSGDKEYRSQTKFFAKRMIEDLVALCDGHNGFLRWAYIHAEEADLDPSSIPVNKEYLILYPIERLSGDLEEEEKRLIEHVEALAEKWKKLEFADIVKRLQRYETDAASINHQWPRFSTCICRLLAERRDVAESDVIALVESGVPADLVEPFFAESFKNGVIMDTALKNCIRNKEYRRLTVHYTLMGQTPYLYTEIAEYLPQYTEFIECLAYRGAISEGIMRSLLTHDEKKVCLAAALLEFRSEPKGQVRDCVKSQWHAAMVEGMAELDRVGDLLHVYDLEKIVAYDRSLALDTLITIAKRDESSFAAWDLKPIKPLLSALKREETFALLDCCENMYMTELPKVLIGNDIELYRQFLARPEMRRHHMTPLAGSTQDDGWVDKALVAIEAGHSPKDVVLATRSFHWKSRGPESQMWQECIDEFALLLKHDNPQVQAIGRAGVDWSMAARDKALDEEAREAVYGRSGD